MSAWALFTVHTISLGQAPAAPPADSASGEAKPAAPAADKKTDGSASAASATGSGADTIPITDFLVLESVGHYGRLPLARDAVEAQIVNGTWQEPVVGSSVDFDDDRAIWLTTSVGDDGTLDSEQLRGGYAFATFESPREQVLLLEASGHAAVYVNGEPHAGDPYGLGWLRLPVLVKKGQNTLLFHVGGERLSARLVPPPAPVSFIDQDLTVPTVDPGATEAVWAALPVVNASRDWLEGAEIEASRVGGESLATPVAAIPPLSVRKVGFQMPPAGETAAGDDVPYTVRLLKPGGGAQASPQPLAETTVLLHVAKPGGIHARTFKSRIDGSVQSYVLRPVAGESASESLKPPALIVALHDAGEDPRNFFNVFRPKDWAILVAPTGRRPYGFDWEDWGRTDVLEVIDDVRQRYKTDPSRTYLTGQSMGGHGAWHLGVTYPDKFAAIGPSGGWPSFWSYGGGMPDFEEPDEIQAMMLRGYAPSNTLGLLDNLKDTAVYVRHGSDDPEVPIEQAHFMRNQLAEFHPNFVYFEKPDVEDVFGDAPCDWPAMMTFFDLNAIPSLAERKRIDFTTANPGISDRSGWLRIDAQTEALLPSHVEIDQDLEARTFTGQTNNVARLALEVGHWQPNGPIDVTLDGQTLPRLAWPTDGTTLWFERHDDRWSAAGAPLSNVKGPRRYGTFKSAFDNNVQLVYGTGGNAEENAWAEAKARFDAETFWYRGGGAVDVLPDTKFDAQSDASRNVILYGNADTNRAWPALLADSPVQVHDGKVTFGDNTETGDDLAVLFVYPRSASDTALVGVVAGTGPAGMRLTNRVRYFVSGVAYPDLMIFGPGVLTQGTSDIRAWGYFGPDWSVDAGEIARREPSS